jgi:hypothetical protein
MYNGPKTEKWYVKPGRYVAYSGMNLGGGAYIFHFWHHDNDMIYTYGFGGFGGIKGQLQYLGVAGKFAGSDYGDWMEVQPNGAFSPEELDGASGRLERLGLSIMGVGKVACLISANKGRTLFSGRRVDVKNTEFFSFPVVVLAGRWELLDATKQRETMTIDWDTLVSP